MTDGESAGCIRADEESPSSNGSPRHAMPGETRPVSLGEIALDDMKYQFRVGMRAADLKVSMRDQGQQRPVDLRGSSPPYQLIDGFRRCAAARSLGWSHVVATIHEDIDDLHAFQLAFTRNVVRKNLTSVERANAIRLGMEGGMTKLDLAAKLGMSEKQIERYSALVRMPADVLAAIDKLFTMAHALVMAKFDIKNVRDVIVEVKAKKLTVARFKKYLSIAVGGVTRGRVRKRYVETDGNSIRFYGGSISLDASQEDRERLAEQLLDVAMRLQGDRRSSARAKSPGERAE